MNAIPVDAGIMMRSGAYFNYNDPAAFEGSIEDIAHALSNVCRYAGHCDYFFSVAQHAVNASHAVARGHEFDALMHDTAEAVTGDITTPLKRAVPFFKELEMQIEAGMSKRFNFTYPLSEQVKIVDLQMLKLEREVLFPDATDHWAVLDGVEIESLRGLRGISMSPMGPSEAKQAFLRRYDELRP